LKCDALEIVGRWPTELNGRFYRNGPALFQRAGQRYQHWFAGDGMVQQFRFADGKVSHIGRFVQTDKFKREEAAGKFLVSAFGSSIPTQVRVTGPDSMNTANTNAIEHAGKVLAMWEGGSAYAMDPQTLETRGPVTWQDNWAQMPFSAHPKVDAQGNLWNIGAFGNRMAVYHVNPQGTLAKAQVVKLPIDTKRTGGMVHDMAITAQHLVVPLPPVVIDWAALMKGEIGPKSMRTLRDEPLRIWVGRKDDPSQSQMFELPSEMVFHVGNAFDDGDEVVLSYVGGRSNDFLGATATALMRGQVTEPGESVLCIARLNRRTGTARVERFDTPTEFPRVHPAYVGERARWLVQPASWRAQSEIDPGFHGVQLVNTETGKAERVDLGTYTADEHLIVPKPGKTGERDAWLIATVFDAKRQRTGVHVLDAAAPASGPIATAWLPYALPAGFHGNFTAA
jgi:all-trans-8'-apo-beta-carotenal 15,15'-oxygenase